MTAGPNGTDDTAPDPGREPPESPVTGTATKPRPEPEDGIALCLSGGGYRAMLFHVGALWRLNELGYLPRLRRISSVSGGSITAAVLGSRWDRLGFRDGDGVAERYGAEVVDPIRALAHRTIDQGSVLDGLLSPGTTISDKVTDAYREQLFGEATLDALPDDDKGPRFVINATNVQTGSLWRFSKPYMGDYRIGLVPEPKVELAVAVAASSAFPPVLSPLRMNVDPNSFSPEPTGELRMEPYTSRVVLTDGGVYDNLGLETAWKRYRTVLVSDGGGHMAPDPKPAGDWVRHSLRINALIDNQVRSLRKRQLIAGYHEPGRSGAYWGIRSHAVDYGPPPHSLPCPPDRTLVLAREKTRLAAMDGALQERLVNWGYAICDIAIRRWMTEPGAAPPPAPVFPYARGVG